MEEMKTLRMLTNRGDYRGTASGEGSEGTASEGPEGTASEGPMMRIG